MSIGSRKVAVVPLEQLEIDGHLGGFHLTFNLKLCLAILVLELCFFSLSFECFGSGFTGL